MWPRTISSACAIGLAAATAAFAVVLFDRAVLDDGDTYWHISAGRWMLENWAVLRIDPFSYTVAGHPWQTHEWLAEVAMALAWLGAGWSGLVVLFGAAAALTAGLLARHLSRWLSGLPLAATVLFALACCAGSLLARPHLLALPLLEMWTAGLVIARQEGRAPSWALLPLMALWANLHASFLFGLALLLPFALEAMADAAGRWPGAARRWGLFAAAALIAAILTPHGLEGLVFPFRLMRMPSLASIGEWAPTDFRTFQPLALATGAALYVLLTRGAKVRPLQVVVLLALLYLAVIHVRHHMLAGIAGALVLGEPLGRVLNYRPHTVHRRMPLLAGFAALIGALVALRFWMPLVRGDDASTPASAFAHVPPSIIHAPVLNDYAFGGFLIFNEVRPFIDSRAELYGDAFLRHYQRMVRPDGAALAAALAKYHVRWTIFAADNAAAQAMDAVPGWHRIYADSWAVVHVKEASP